MQNSFFPIQLQSALPALIIYGDEVLAVLVRKQELAVLYI